MFERLELIREAIRQRIMYGRPMSQSVLSPTREKAARLTTYRRQFRGAPPAQPPAPVPEQIMAPVLTYNQPPYFPAEVPTDEAGRPYQTPLNYRW